VDVTTTIMLTTMLTTLTLMTTPPPMMTMLLPMMLSQTMLRMKEIQRCGEWFELTLLNNLPPTASPRSLQWMSQQR